jgi:hypothetical protein
MKHFRFLVLAGLSLPFVFTLRAQELPAGMAPGQTEAGKPAVAAPDLAQKSTAPATKILTHDIQRDAAGGLLGWYRPDVPGAAYDRVVRLAAAFVRDGTPNDPKTGLPLYFISCSFNGPPYGTEADFRAGKTWDDWMNNPACFFAGAVQSLAVDFHAYTGDRSYIDLVRRMLDHQLEFGTTPAGWPWPLVPYASADPGNPRYEGATRWENAGMRGDGLHGIEPDKIGELGVGYAKFYQLTEETKYLEAALHCADALAAHVADVTMKGDDFAETKSDHSPWPYRVNARTGATIDPYTANVIEPIRLFDEVLRMGDRIALSADRTTAYQKARALAWSWLLSRNGPLISYVWNGYFEDVPSDPKLSNRVQIIPMETARYLLKASPPNVDVLRQSLALAAWVKAAFGEPGEPSINEQTWCYVPMASHTARYASIEALLYERTGDARHKEEAYRHFNWATYSCTDTGVVSVGPRWTGTWWSDGYGDYIRHFFEGLAAIPEWAPADQNHLLRSSSLIQEIKYEPTRIAYRAYDEAGRERLRLAARPKQVSVGKYTVTEHSAKQAAGPGWTWKPLPEGGGVLDLERTGGREVTVLF